LASAIPVDISAANTPAKVKRQTRKETKSKTNAAHHRPQYSEKRLAEGTSWSSYETATLGRTCLTAGTQLARDTW
jgi:hypothetical protein